ALRMMRRAAAVPDVPEIHAMRAAALARPRPGVSDAEIYATVARLLALRAGVDEVLARLSALLGEDQVPQRKAHEGGAPGRAARGVRSCTRPPGRSAAAGPSAVTRNGGRQGRAL